MSEVSSATMTTASNIVPSRERIPSARPWCGSASSAEATWDFGVSALSVAKFLNLRFEVT